MCPWGGTMRCCRQSNQSNRLQRWSRLLGVGGVMGGWSIYSGGICEEHCSNPAPIGTVIPLLLTRIQLTSGSELYPIIPPNPLAHHHLWPDLPIFRYKRRGWSLTTFHLCHPRRSPRCHPRYRDGQVARATAAKGLSADAAEQIVSIIIDLSL